MSSPNQPWVKILKGFVRSKGLFKIEFRSLWKTCTGTVGFDLVKIKRRVSCVASKNGTASSRGLLKTVI